MFIDLAEDAAGVALVRLNRYVFPCRSGSAVADGGQAGLLSTRSTKREFAIMQ